MYAVFLFKIYFEKMSARGVIPMTVSAFYERAAVNKVDDLRVLGIITNKHFFKMERGAKFVKRAFLYKKALLASIVYPYFCGLKQTEIISPDRALLSTL